MRKPNGNPLVPISKPVKRPNKTTDHSTRAAAPVQRFDPTPMSEHPRGPSAPPHPRTAASCSTDAAMSVPPSRPSGTTDTSRPAAAVRPTKTTKALKLLRADLKAGQVVQYNNTQMTVGPDGVTLVKKRGRPFEDAKVSNSLFLRQMSSWRVMLAQPCARFRWFPAPPPSRGLDDGCFCVCWCTEGTPKGCARVVGSKNSTQIQRYKA